MLMAVNGESLCGGIRWVDALKLTVPWVMCVRLTFGHEEGRTTAEAEHYGGCG